MYNTRMFSSNYILLRALCTMIYYLGLGDYWYEEKHKSTLKKFLDELHSFVVPFGFFILICSEYLAVFGAGGYPDLLKQEAVSFALSQSCVLSQLIMMKFKKRPIKELVEELIEAGQAIEQERLITDQMARIKRTLCIFSTVVFSTICSIGFAAVFNKVKSGIPFRTVVTYPPNYGEDTVLSNLIAICSLFYLSYMMLPMIVSDILAISSIIILSTKYKLLCKYLEEWPRDAEDDKQISPNKTTKELTGTGCSQNIEINYEDSTGIISNQNTIIGNNIEEVLIHGISIHIKLLRCKRLIEKSFGESMSLQIINSSVTLIFLMLKILADHSLSVMMTIFFFFTMLVMLAQYLFNAGELTHQASLLPNSIYGCGWESAKTNQRIKILMTLAMVQAQKPVVLKAFGVLDLSYSTFVQVLKTTYSVFTVFY